MTADSGVDFGREVGSVPEHAKPRAWAVFVDSEKVRLWSTLQPHVQSLADAQGLTVTELYDQTVLDAAVAAAREECALVCDRAAAAAWSAWDAVADPIDQGRALEAEALALEFRAEIAMPARETGCRARVTLELSGPPKSVRLSDQLCRCNRSEKLYIRGAHKPLAPRALLAYIIVHGQRGAAQQPGETP